MSLPPEDVIHLTEQEWRERLTPEEYHVLREAGTEAPFSGKYTECHDKGSYHCAGCDLPLFSWQDKFDSGSGWPSFTHPIHPRHVDFFDDYKHAVRRTEVRCSRCGGHLGHVFDDGPPPTRKRYCINSIALKFVPNHEKKE